MARALTSIVTLVMVIIIMVSIVQSIPSSINGSGGGGAVQIAYTSDLERTSPTNYAQAILSSR